MGSRLFAGVTAGLALGAVLVAGPACPRNTPKVFSYFLNTDPDSLHWLSGGASDGSDYDIFASADDFASDLLGSDADGDTILLQFDQESRPTFAQTPDGSSMRVHDYLPNGMQEVTLTTPTGATTRAVVDFSVVLDDLATSPKRDAVQAAEKDYRGEKQFDPRCEAVRIWIQLLEELDAVERLLHTIDCLAEDENVNGEFPSAAEIEACVNAAAGETALSPLLQDLSDWINGLDCDTVESCDSDVPGDCPFEEQDPPIHAPETTVDIPLGTGDVQVTLWWETDMTDLDLHVIDPAGSRIFFNVPASASGGSLDLDDTDGFGPENIFWPTDGAPSGPYQVEVVYFTDLRVPPGPTNYTVRVLYPDGADGHIEETFTGTLAEADRTIRVPVTMFTVPE